MTVLEVALGVGLSMTIVWWAVDHLLLTERIQCAAVRLENMEDRLIWKNEELKICQRE